MFFRKLAGQFEINKRFKRTFEIPIFANILDLKDRMANIPLIVLRRGFAIEHI